MRAVEHRAGRWRAAAVAAVLVAGGVATVATTAPLERCPEPTSEVTASAFFGDQEYDDPRARAADPSTGAVAGFTVADAQVRVPSCVAASGSTAEVSVSMDYAAAGDAPSGPGDIEDVGAGMRITDGDGLTWPARDVHAYPGSPAQDGRAAIPATLSVSFGLPVDIASPVVLHLGGPEDDVLSLDPGLRADPSPESGRLPGDRADVSALR
ncbi:hypothetical protein KIN34_04005 [Cellulomonas sp. DKR-3]|uniref:Uncharacterized protein n=1 Tax=Cellulomonas fulva TaxID=2835530 RepID=A0ABS5TWF8_9CELL|nr:hypothetical protein [Cellulomonas fulva]MBT0993448.1 hypothetical protein [Cellulomonas fulva]